MNHYTISVLSQYTNHVVLAALLLLAPGLCLAQSTGTIHLDITDAAANPLRARVNAIGLDSGEWQSLDVEAGEAEWSLPSGNYRVYVEVYERGVPVLVEVKDIHSRTRQTRTDIVDVRIPPRVEPEDRFRVAFEATGTNRPGDPIGPADASLEITRVRGKPDGSEESVDIHLEEPPPPVEKGVPGLAPQADKPRERI